MGRQTESDVQQPVLLQVLMGCVRTAICVVGGVLGYAFAMVLNSFPVGGGGSRFIRYVEIIATMGLCLAAPVCLYLAFTTRARDRWTLAYLLAWVAFIVANYIGVFISNVTG